MNRERTRETERERDARRFSNVDFHHRHTASIHASPDAPRASVQLLRILPRLYISLPPLLHAVHAWQSGGVSTSRCRPGLIGHKTGTSTRDETLKTRRQASVISCHHLYEAIADPKERRLKGKVDFDPIGIGWNRRTLVSQSKRALKPIVLERASSENSHFAVVLINIY